MNPRQILPILALAALAQTAHPQTAHAQIMRSGPIRALPMPPGTRFGPAPPTTPRIALDNAIARDDKAAVLALLRTNPNLINSTVPYGYTPFQGAVQAGHVDMTALLLDHGADINARDQFGRTPLQNSVLNPGSESIAMLDLLLARGANVHAFDDEGLTPLHVAARNDNILAVQRLLAHGISVAEQSENGDTPLHTAAAAASFPAAALLISSGAPVNARNHEGDTPLHAAMRAFQYFANGADGADAGKAAMEQLLLDHGAHVSTPDHLGFTPLLWSLLSRDKIVHAVLLQFHPAMDPQTAFLETTAQNNVPRLRRLLQADPQLASARIISGASPLHVAALWNAQACAALLLARKANINTRDAQGQTPLHYAARIQNNASMTAWLLARRADPNAADIQGSTPLHEAVRAGASPAVALLLAHHAAVNALNHSRQSPLELTLPSSYNGDADVNAAAALPITLLLLQAGADPNISTFNGSETPIIRAVEMRDLPLLRLLLDHGANPNTAPSNHPDNNPLMTAVEYGSTETVPLLLARGADTAAKNNQGQTALDIAVRTNHPDIAALLRAAPTPKARTESPPPAL